MFFIKKNIISISIVTCIVCFAFISFSGCVPKKKIAQASESHVRENTIPVPMNNDSKQTPKNERVQIGDQIGVNATKHSPPLTPSLEEVTINNDPVDSPEKIYYENIGPKSVPGEDRHAVAVPVVTGFVGNVPKGTLLPQPLPETILTPEQAEPIADQPDAAITDEAFTDEPITGAERE